jgi:hypothetical protein
VSSACNGRVAADIVDEVQSASFQQGFSKRFLLLLLPSPPPLDKDARAVA